MTESFQFPPGRPSMAGVAQSEIDAQSSGSSTPPIGAIGHRKTGSLNVDEIEQLKGKTSFRLAHPPPITKHKQRLRIRPRVLLQLHQFSDKARANLDVLPSTIFAPRLSSKFPKLFRGKAGLGPHDLVVMSSCAHRPSSRSHEDNEPPVFDESWDTNEAIATICQARRPSSDTRAGTEICFTNGKSWQAYQLPNGSYEFTSENEDGSTTTARWVIRRKSHQRTSTNQDALQQSHDRKDRRLNFSLINPTRRKHPVIASMTRDAINVNHSYQAVIDGVSSPTELGPSSDSSPPPESDTATNYFDGAHSSGTQAQKGPLIETDEALRMLIVITGIWVVFKEGWSKNFSYDDAAGNNGSTDSAVRRNTSKRHASQPSATNKNLGSSDDPAQGRRSTSQVIRTSLSLRKSSKRSPTRSSDVVDNDGQIKRSKSKASKDDRLKSTNGAHGASAIPAPKNGRANSNGGVPTAHRYRQSPGSSSEHAQNGNGVRKGGDDNLNVMKKGSGGAGHRLRKRLHSLLGVLGHHSKH